MIDFLFRGLTAEPARGAPLFDAVTKKAREPHWYVEGKVPDTFDGRFAILSALTALVIVRLEQEGDAGNRASVSLTERFIEVMESEHRELGLGDPSLGRTVRKLVSILAKRAELWRSASASEQKWSKATIESLYKDNPPSDALRHSSEELKRYWSRLGRIGLADFERGKLG